MKKINRNELIWMLILSALFVGLARLLLTGEILFFLHPKMIKFVIVTEVILFAMIVFQNLYADDHKGSNGTICIFVTDYRYYDETDLFEFRGNCK